MLESQAILARAKHYEAPMTQFLRDIIAIPSESAQEGPVIARIRQEMEQLGGFDRIWTDPFGNLFGQIGAARPLIAIDAHIDTVGLGDPAEWPHDPYQGKVAGGTVFGRGAGDQKGAVPPMVYAGRILRDLGVQDPPWSLLLAFTVSEEDCDGLNWQYIVREGGLRPDCVIITDSTNCRIHRGQRGRMEIGVTVRGRSCHASMPHKGDNAVHKMARVVREIEALGRRLKKDRFLGQGTIAVTYIDCKTPSLCAVPDHAYIHLDRRLTTGETKASALREVRDAARRAGVTATVKVLRYEKPTYTGLTYPTESYFPTWSFPADAAPVAAAAETYRTLFRKKPPVTRWTFSTNGVSIAGMFGIPSVGFGPAPEDVAHTVRDSVPIKHLVQCAAFYAAFPDMYCARAKKPGPAKPKKRRSRK